MPYFSAFWGTRPNFGTISSADLEYRNPVVVAKQVFASESNTSFTTYFASHDPRLPTYAYMSLPEQLFVRHFWWLIDLGRPTAHDAHKVNCSSLCGLPRL